MERLDNGKPTPAQILEGSIPEGGDIYHILPSEEREILEEKLEHFATDVITAPHDSTLS